MKAVTKTENTQREESTSRVVFPSTSSASVQRCSKVDMHIIGRSTVPRLLCPQVQSDLLMAVEDGCAAFLFGMSGFVCLGGWKESSVVGPACRKGWERLSLAMSDELPPICWNAFPVPHRGSVFHHWSYKCGIKLYELLDCDASAFVTKRNYRLLFALVMVLLM